MQKINILFIVSTLKSCGPTQVVYNICKYFDLNKIRPTILTLSPEPFNSSIGLFKDLGIATKTLNMSRISGVFKASLALKKIVKDIQPQVIFSHGIRADNLSANYLTGYLRIATVHNYPFYDYPMFYGKFIGYLMAKKHINILKRIDIPIACSKAVSENLAKHHLFCSFIRNGIDTDIYQPTTEENQLSMRIKLGLPVNKKIIVSVGSLIKRKNPQTLLRSFLKSNLKNNALLLMIGDGNLKNACEQIASGESSIKFIGRVNNVVDYLKASDYFITTSLAEGLPNALMEALACGLPVCVSDIEAHLEIINLDNTSGIVFPLGNIEVLPQKLEQLLNQDRNLMSKSALKLVRENLTAKMMSNNYQYLFDNSTVPKIDY